MFIVADDLGRKVDDNEAILAALERNLVSTASAMANCRGMQALADRVVKEGLGARIGLHFNLTEGEPITDAIKEHPRFCTSDGKFYMWRKSRPLLRLTSAESQAVYFELSAQINLLREAGLAINTLDSHHHVHTEPGIARIMVKSASELGIQTIRIGRNIGKGRGIVNRSYKLVLNAALRSHGISRSRNFGTLGDLNREARSYELGGLEVMVHLRWGASGLEDYDFPGVPVEQLL